MQIYGFQKTTLLDYPGKVAATVFTGGCNFRCSFCHNMNLVENLNNESKISENYVLETLAKRKNILDGVCITGGEPTLQPDLISFIQKLREMGYKIKLDSNGSIPSVIKTLVLDGLVDYIAIDVKSSFNNYLDVVGLYPLTGTKEGLELLENIRETIQFLIKQDRIPYEFRTTVVRDFHTKDTFNSIGKLLSGSTAYYLQSFVDSAFVPNHALSAYTKNELQEFAMQLKNEIQKVEIRGLD